MTFPQTGALGPRFFLESAMSFAVGFLVGMLVLAAVGAVVFLVTFAKAMKH